MESKLPKNWVKTSPLEISKIIRGVSYGKTDAFQFEFDNSCLILRGGNIQDGEIVDGKDNVYVSIDLIKNEQFIQKYDVIIVGSTGSKNLIGKAATSLFESNKISFGAFLMNIRAFETIDKRYFSYYFQTNYYREAIRNLAGGVNINNIRKEYIENLYFPLPPLAEQNRIVVKLDRLFAQLETIKSSMSKIPELLKDFRQQVLKQAVTGKLTNKNDIISVSLSSTITIGSLFEEAPLNWKWVKLIDIAKLESGHTPRKSEEEYWINGNVPWISLQDIRAAHGKIINETKYMPNELGIKKSSARLLPKGTVCFCRDISVGYTTVMGKEMSTTQHFANWICGNSLNNMFLLYVFMSAKDFLIASGKGTTVGTIYMPALKELRILLPPLEEQLQIVRRVEKLFAKADAIEHQYKTLKAKIDTLPQAILHKAFKGELSEQLDTDGDARELLEEIKALKYATGKVLKSKTTKKATKKVKSYPENDEVLGMVAEP
ncbi:restriction endonuclease subunit S [Flavobacterium granuli]|uniref:Type I restriction enzyme S subunit n=1 Tax=Flavobacterium granuli TaxID=280093 RepID=A0A1M5RM98_9FLAO|nr:restriction endonuclease subunit S [Flavobacterium granuli]PRZ22822.1 type I restriction enzyme S subunit [Flavobacterium granuli]SHH27300.1 type I restriction enzyme, S subunit [Flavobacterium granuli]